MQQVCRRNKHKQVRYIDTQVRYIDTQIKSVSCSTNTNMSAVTPAFSQKVSQSATEKKKTQTNQSHNTNKSVSELH